MRRNLKRRKVTHLALSWKWEFFGTWKWPTYWPTLTIFLSRPSSMWKLNELASQCWLSMHSTLAGKLYLLTLSQFCCVCTCSVTAHFTINFLIHVCLSDSPAWPEGRDCTARAGGSHNARKAFWGNPETEVSVPKREKNLSKGIWWKDTGNGSTGLTGEYLCKLLNRCTLVVQRVET